MNFSAWEDLKYRVFVKNNNSIDMYYKRIMNVLYNLAFVEGTKNAKKKNSYIDARSLLGRGRTTIQIFDRECECA